MKKVLIVTYYWPPGSGPGVQRFLKFSKYLKDFGWEPIILTVKNGSYPSYDESLEEDISHDLKVYKTETFEPYQWYNFLKGKKGKSSSVGMIDMSKKSIIQKLSLYVRANFFIPDARKGWRKYAVKKALELHQTHSLDAVITTGPPHSAHLIGLDLKNKINKPWVADFRDPWTTVFYNAFFPRSERVKIKDKFLEDTVVKSCDLLTVISQGMVDEFKDRSDNIALIYNGYDQDDILSVMKSKSEKFTISYTGNFKSNQNVFVFWQALSDLCDQDREFSNSLKIELTGNIDLSVLHSIHDYGLGKHLVKNGFMNHKEAVKKMMNTELLLFVVPKSDRNKLIITGKLFEYLATGNPILAIGPSDGNASAILNDAKRDGMHEYNSMEGIKKQILSTYQNWKNNVPQQFDTNDIKRFSREGLTKLLAQHLNNLIDE